VKAQRKKKDNNCPFRNRNDPVGHGFKPVSGGRRTENIPPIRKTNKFGGKKGLACKKKKDGSLQEGSKLWGEKKDRIKHCNQGNIGLRRKGAFR